MIAPDMATMLGFIFTNMSIDSEVLQELTSEITERTFNAITIDSDTSTSDTVLVIASCKSNMPKIKTIGDPRVLVFKEALESVMQHLAHEIVHDGEGASKFVEYKINGAENDLAAKKIGFSIANSPLVKTALVGEDPNWGRIVMAIGKSGQKVDRDKLSIYFGETLVAEKGSEAKDYDEAITKKYMKNTNLVIRVDLEVGNGSFTVWGCDLTNEYISINANYRS
jgi:glutamate N-acetyltransferase/amino-acid N-acetyltransferase